MVPVPVVLLLDNRVRLDERALPQGACEELYAAFSHSNPQRAKLKSLGLPHWNEPAIIRTWARARTGLTFPRGGLARIRTILGRHGVAFVVRDRRTEGVGGRGVPDHRVALYPYQADAVDVLEARQNCIVRAPTGSGKSTLALALVARLKLPTLIVVWSGALFDQWRERAGRELGLRPKDVGTVRAGTCKLQPVTIGMQQTIAARGAASLRDYFGVVILDETQRAAAGSVYAAIDPFPAKYRIGISADECVARGTLISMADGACKPIEEVRAGDWVVTPSGSRRVRSMFNTGISETVEVCVAGRSLRCTLRTKLGAPTGWVEPESRCYLGVYVERRMLRGLRWPDAAALHDPLSHELQTDAVLGGGELLGMRGLGTTRQSPKRASRRPSSMGAVGQGQDEGDGSAACSYFAGSIGSAEGGTTATRQGSRQADDITTGGEGACGYDDPCSILARRTPGGVGADEWRQRQVAKRSGDARGAGNVGDRPGSWAYRRDGSRQLASTSLQAGLCSPKEKSCSGDRWDESPWSGVWGREEGLAFSEARLGRAQVSGDSFALFDAEVGCDVSPAKVTRDGLHLQTFDLEIEGSHCFYANGVLLHNSRKDRKQFLIYDLFGDVAVDIKRGDLVDSGHVLDVEVRVVPTRFRAPWFGWGRTDDARADLDFDRLLGEMSADAARDALAVDHALAEVEAGEQVLVMSHRREHCQSLAAAISARGVRVGLLIGGQDYAKEFARARDGILRGEIRVGVGTYQAVGTGLDLPRVGVAVCATPIAGNKQFFGQVRGRVCRVAEGKSGARLVYLLDPTVYPGHLKNLRAWNKRVLVLGGGRWQDAGSWEPGPSGVEPEEVADAEAELGGRGQGPASSERLIAADDDDDGGVRDDVPRVRR